jgi:hypothetical protein
MSLAPGATLGPYEITGIIGAGGLGHVYQARDTRTRRDVALRVLDAAALPDPSARERVLADARAVIGLQHPHAAALYEVGRDQDMDYLAGELVQGETLTAQLGSGPLPMHRALRIGTQVLDALQAAHRRRVLHRHLEPDTVIVTPLGVKVIEFGVVRPPLPSYQAPEQAAGRAADPRSDIYACGALLYHMLTGQRPSGGGEAAGRDPVPLRALQPTLPISLDRIVMKCLARDPARRWQSVGDLRDALTWVEETADERTRVRSRGSSTRLHRRRLERTAWMAALVAMAALLAWSFARDFGAAPPVRAARRTVSLAPAERMGHLLAPALALSADGTTIAYVGSQQGETALFVRRLDELEGRRVPGTTGAENPVFSPEGRWIAFAAGGFLQKVAVGGGDPVALAPVDEVWGISWAGPEAIVYASGAEGGIWRVPAGGGSAEQVMAVQRARDEHGHHWPYVIPGTNIMLVARLPLRRVAMDDAQIVAVSLDTGSQRVLVDAGTQPRYLSTGHLAYVQSGTLYAVPLDLKDLAVTGTPQPVVEGVLETPHGAAHYSVSEAGHLVFLGGGTRGMQRHLVWVDRTGSITPLTAPPGAYVHPRISPDGRRVATRVVAPFCDVVVYDVAGDYVVRLPLDGDNHAPIWVEDGERVLVQTVLADSVVLRWVRADGVGAPEVVFEGSRAGQDLRGESWSRDGQTLVAANETDVVVLALERGPTRLVVANTFPGTAPALSPDARWIAYAAPVGGRHEIFVRSFPSLDGEMQVTTLGGTEPAWGADGELFYRERDRLMAVRPAIDGMAAEPPAPLFTLPLEPGVGPSRSYDVTPDGKRFLMVQSDESVAVPQATLVADWFADVRRVE